MKESEAYQNEILLDGLDGANPLAFMAALGAIYTISSKEPGKLSWEINDGSWKPKIVMEGASRTSLVSLIDAALEKELNEVWALSKRLPFEAELLRKAALDCATTFELGSRDTGRHACGTRIGKFCRRERSVSGHRFPDGPFWRFCWSRIA